MCVPYRHEISSRLIYACAANSHVHNLHISHRFIIIISIFFYLFFRHWRNGNKSLRCTSIQHYTKSQRVYFVLFYAILFSVINCTMQCIEHISRSSQQLHAYISNFMRRIYLSFYLIITIMLSHRLHVSFQFPLSVASFCFENSILTF